MAAWLALLRGSTLVLAALDAELEAAHGLSLAEYEILVVLSAEPAGLRMGALAERSLVSKSRLSHTCDRLERDGLVERRKCPTDRRGLTAMLTEAGRARLEAAAPTHVEGVRRHVIDVLGADDLRALTEAMSAVADSFGPAAPDPSASCPNGPIGSVSL